MDLRQRDLAEPGAVLQRRAVEFVEQDPLHGQSRTRRVAVAGQEHQARVETPVRVLTEEQPQPAPPGECDRPRSGGVERIDVGRQQIGQRPVLQDLQHLLARVRLHRESGPMDDLADTPIGHGDVEHVLVQSRRREHAEEAMLTRHPAFVVERLDPDVVRVDGPMHCGLGTGLGQHQQRRRQHARSGVGAVDEVTGGETVLTKHPQAGGQNGPQHGFVAALRLGHHLVVAVSQEHEVPVGQPSQPLHTLGHLLLGQRRWLFLERCGDVRRRPRHLVGVLDDLSDVVEHPDQPVVQFPGALRVADRIDLQVHPRLDDGTGRWGRDVGLGVDLLQSARHIPVHDHDGVHDALHLNTTARQFGDHGVHQIRHVVRDHLDDRGLARPTVVLNVRVEQSDHRPARYPLPSELHV